MIEPDLEQPSFIDNLAAELQSRIGILPNVEVYNYFLNHNSEQIIPTLRVQPKSYSEIARSICAARTMKLNVRGTSDKITEDLEIDNLTNFLIVDCNELCDSKKFEFVTIKRKLEDEEIEGLKILACAKLHELVDFEISYGIEISQSMHCASIHDTVVGAITLMNPGLVGPAGKARGACLADEVICIRIVDCNGDLIEYSSDDEITSAVSSMGILGIVYDVVVRYNQLSLTKVNLLYFKCIKGFS